MRRKILFYLINALMVITIFYFSEVVGETIVNNSRLIKISLMWSFVLGLIYSIILDHLGFDKE